MLLLVLPVWVPIRKIVFPSDDHFFLFHEKENHLKKEEKTMKKTFLLTMGGIR